MKKQELQKRLNLKEVKEEEHYCEMWKIREATLLEKFNSTNDKIEKAKIINEYEEQVFPYKYGGNVNKSPMVECVFKIKSDEYSKLKTSLLLSSEIQKLIRDEILSIYKACLLDKLSLKTQDIIAEEIKTIIYYHREIEGKSCATITQDELNKIISKLPIDEGDNILIKELYFNENIKSIKKFTNQICAKAHELKEMYGDINEYTAVQNKQKYCRSMEEIVSTLKNSKNILDEIDAKLCSK